MFKLSEISTKLIIGAVVLLMLVAVLFWINHKDDKIVDLAKKNAVQEVTIQVQDTTIKNDAKSDKVNEETNANVAANTAKVTKKGKKTIKKVEDKVEQIADDFAQKPDTVDNVVEKSRQTSAAQIAGLWELYCEHSPPGADGCAKPSDTKKG